MINPTPSIVPILPHDFERIADAIRTLNEFLERLDAARKTARQVDSIVYDAEDHRQ